MSSYVRRKKHLSTWGKDWKTLQWVFSSGDQHYRRGHFPIISVCEVVDRKLRTTHCETANNWGRLEDEWNNGALDFVPHTIVFFSWSYVRSITIVECTSTWSCCMHRYPKDGNIALKCQRHQYMWNYKMVTGLQQDVFAIWRENWNQSLIFMYSSTALLHRRPRLAGSLKPY